jgi:hypothetical protein
MRVSSAETKHCPGGDWDLLWMNDSRVGQFLCSATSNLSDLLLHTQRPKDKPHGRRPSTNPHGQLTDPGPVQGMFIRLSVDVHATAHILCEFGDVFVHVEGCIAEFDVAGLLFGEVGCCDEEFGVEICDRGCAD